MTDTPSTKSAKSARTTAPGPEARTVFVVSPIGKSGTPEYRRAKLVLDFIIKKAFPKPHWTVVRADDEESPDSISTQVIRRIRESDLIVADLSGHNPNVFYELAVAHGYERPVIHMISAGETMPFDIADQRAISYELENPESVDAAITKMAASQRWLDDNPDLLRTPLSTYGAFTAISSTQPGSESNEAIAEALGEIVHRLGRLERSTKRREPGTFRAYPAPSVTKASARPEPVSNLWDLLEIVESEIRATKESADMDDPGVRARLENLYGQRDEISSILHED